MPPLPTTKRAPHSSAAAKPTAAHLGSSSLGISKNRLFWSGVVELILGEPRLRFLQLLLPKWAEVPSLPQDHKKSKEDLPILPSIGLSAPYKTLLVADARNARSHCNSLQHFDHANRSKSSLLEPSNVISMSFQCPFNSFQFISCLSRRVFSLILFGTVLQSLSASTWTAQHGAHRNGSSIGWQLRSKPTTTRVGKRVSIDFYKSLTLVELRKGATSLQHFCFKRSSRASSFR